MEIFRVYANSHQRSYIEVKAKNKNEAYDIALEADGGDFIEENIGDWEIEQDTIEKIKGGKIR